MAKYYTKEQQDAIATIIGTRVKAATQATKLVTAIEGVADKNFVTDAELAKLSSLESSKFLGTFTTSAAIPVVSASEGSYAHVDAGVGTDVELWIYDNDDTKFIKSYSQIAGETGASIKTKYESNANTNVFTDSHKTKLDGLVEASNITDFTSALDGALA